MSRVRDRVSLMAPEELLEWAVGAYGRAVYRFAFSQMGSRHAAEDIAQDVFAALYASGKRFDDSYHAKCWLMKSTLNRCRSIRRLSVHRKEVPTDPQELRAQENDEGFGKDPADATDAFVWRLVQQLPFEQREVIHLKFVEDFSTREIARIVGVPCATVRTRLFRARRGIRKLIEKEGAHGLL